MSLSLSMSLDGHDLNGYPSATNTAVGDGFQWPTPVPEREWTERKVGQIQTPNPRRNNFELEIPLQVRGTEDEIEEELGKIQIKCNKAEAFAHRGGIELTAQASDATYTTTLQVLAGEITQHPLDFKELSGVATCTLKLYCLPWLLGPWRDVATGRKPEGVAAWEVQMPSLTGHVAGPARVTLTNEGATGQQGVWLGLDASLDSADNSLILEPSTFDYTTAPLNGIYTAAVAEVQTATKSGPISGGTYTLTWEGQTTTSIAAGASPGTTVQAAVDAAFGSGLFVVSGSALTSGNLVFTATGKLVGSDLSLIVLNSSLTGGGSAPITQTTQGVAGYVANTSLQSSWSAFMRTGDQTDEGPFDLWALVVTSADANMCRVRATISVGDTSSGITNNSVSVPASGAAIWVNLGPVNAKKRQSAGTYRWNATISAKTLGTVGTYCRIRKIAKRPAAHGVGLVRTIAGGSSTVVAKDAIYPTQTRAAAALGGQTPLLGAAWATSGDLDDFSTVASSHLIRRTATGDTAGSGRLGLFGPSLGSCSIRGFTLTSSATRQALVARGTDKNNLLMLDRRGSTFELVKRVGGSETTIRTMSAPYLEAYDFSIEVWDSGIWYAYFHINDASSIVMGSGYDAALAASGALATGKCGIYDEWTSGSALTRTYGMLIVTGLPSVEAAIHPARDLVWQPDGQIEREAVGGTYYANAAGQQRTGAPLLAPATLDGYVNRLLIASADLNPDYAASGGIPPALTYKVEHRPAFAVRRHTS